MTDRVSEIREFVERIHDDGEYPGECSTRLANYCSDLLDHIEETEMLQERVEELEGASYKAEERFGSVADLLKRNRTEAARLLINETMAGLRRARLALGGGDGG